MDSQNYVAPAPGGGFVTVVAGKVVGNYATQNAAENAYNGASGPTGSPAAPTGNLSVEQMTIALQAAGYNGPWDDASVTAAYNRTVNGGNATSTQYGYDPTAASIALQTANNAATAAYQQALIKGASDRLAFDEATQAWTQTMQTAQLTGTFNGQPTLAAQAQNNSEATDLLKLDASLTGPANAFEYAKDLAGTPGGLADIVRAAGGQYKLPAFGGGNNQPIQPLSIQSLIDNINTYSPNPVAPVAPTTGGGPAAPAPGGGSVASYQTINGTKTLAQMQAELRTAGWGGNYNDASSVAAAYASTSKGTVTASPGPTSPATPTAPAAPTVPTAPAAQTASNNFSLAPYAPKVAIAPDPNDGSSGSAPSASAAANGAQGAYTPNAPTAAQAPAAMTDPSSGFTGSSASSSNGVDPSSGAGAKYVPSMVPPYGTLPPPNQIAPQAWNNMDPGQQQLLLGAYGQAGWDQNDVLAEFTKSLRGYGGPQIGSVGF